MIQCIRCLRVKYWFQMYRQGTHTVPLCQVCAKQLQYQAVCELTERRPQPQALVDRVAVLEHKVAQLLSGEAA